MVCAVYSTLGEELLFLCVFYFLLLSANSSLAKNIGVFWYFLNVTFVYDTQLEAEDNN